MQIYNEMCIVNMNICVIIRNADTKLLSCLFSSLKKEGITYLELVSMCELYDLERLL